MTSDYDSVYISPHLDDAVLSCGGQISWQAQRDERVLVVTVAAGSPAADIRSPFAQFLHHQWGLTAAEAVSRRRAEDRIACRRLGAETLHWSLPDAIYRLHPENRASLYTSNDDIFGSIHPSEKPLIEDLALFFSSLPHARRIVAPLALGDHVDHQLVRAAAEQAWDSSLLYYEDYPYVQRDPQALERALQPIRQWRSYLIPLSHSARAARIDAIKAYTSQISSLFNTAEQMEAAVIRQTARTGGERLWQQLHT